VDLFQASVAIDKTGDTLSKVGDSADYTITVTNTSSADSPSLTCDISDPLLGVAKNVNLAPGAADVTNASRVVQAGDPDPLLNTASVTCTVNGFGNVIGPVSDGHSVELFQPSVAVVKTGDALSKLGDDVTYEFTITNTSSADSPDLNLASVSDSVLGGLTATAGANGCGTLAAGDSCNFSVAYTVQAGDPDPLVNQVDVLYHPEGFPNDITGSGSHELDLVAPAYTLDKQCAPETGTIGELVTYTISIENTGDVALNEISADDSLLGDLSAAFPDTLPPGQLETVITTRAIQLGDPNELTNEITTVYQVDGLPNELELSSSCSVQLALCALSPGFWKGGNGLPKWDEPGDAIAIIAGFHAGTVFPYLDPSIAGSTYIDVLEFGVKGDITKQISFKYIAARLNEASVSIPSSIGDLLDAVDVYFMANPVGSDPTGQAKQAGRVLLDALNDYFAEVGEGNCPDPDSF
jgi:uncharacterized repeat protein (TIGR01451 family)